MERVFDVRDGDRGFPITAENKLRFKDEAAFHSYSIVTLGARDTYIRIANEDQLAPSLERSGSERDPCFALLGVLCFYEDRNPTARLSSKGEFEPCQVRGTIGPLLKNIRAHALATHSQATDFTGARWRTATTFNEDSFPR